MGWKKILLIYFLGTTANRRNEEISRLNRFYVESIPVHKTIMSCFKFLCETEHYRMLKDWTYQINSDPLPSETPHPESTGVCSVSVSSSIIIIYFL